MQDELTKTFTWQWLLEECGVYVVQELGEPKDVSRFSEYVGATADYAMNALADARATCTLEELAEESISAADYAPATYCRMLQYGIQCYPLDVAQAYRHALSLLDMHLANAAAMVALRQGGAIHLID